MSTLQDYPELLVALLQSNDKDSKFYKFDQFLFLSLLMDKKIIAQQLIQFFKEWDELPQEEKDQYAQEELKIKDLIKKEKEEKQAQMLKED